MPGVLKYLRHPANARHWPGASEGGALGGTRRLIKLRVKCHMYMKAILKVAVLAFLVIGTSSRCVAERQR
jgi:hypothetical protein